MIGILRFVFGFLFISVIFQSIMNANGVVIVDGSGEVLELTESYVDVQINSQIAVVTSQQRYQNRVGYKYKVWLPYS